MTKTLGCRPKQKDRKPKFTSPPNHLVLLFLAIITFVISTIAISLAIMTRNDLYCYEYHLLLLLILLNPASTTFGLCGD